MHYFVLWCVRMCEAFRTNPVYYSSRYILSAIRMPQGHMFCVSSNQDAEGRGPGESGERVTSVALL